MSEVSEEVATQIAKNCRRRQPHSHLRLPPRGTSRECPRAPYISRNYCHGPTFLSLMVRVYADALLKKPK